MVKGKVFSLKAVHQKAIFFAAINGDRAKAIIQFRSLTCVSRGYVWLHFSAKEKKKLAYVVDRKDFPRNVFLIINFVFSQFR